MRQTHDRISEVDPDLAALLTPLFVKTPEQEGVLKDKPKLAPQAIFLNLTDILPIDGDRPTINIIHHCTI